MTRGLRAGLGAARCVGERLGCVWGTSHPHSTRSCTHTLCVCRAHTWPCNPGGLCAVPTPPGQAWPHWGLMGTMAQPIRGALRLYSITLGWSWRDGNLTEHQWLTGSSSFPVLHVPGASCGFLGTRILLSCSWQELWGWGSTPYLPQGLCSGGGSASPPNPALCPLFGWAGLKGLESPPETKVPHFCRRHRRA